MDALQNEGTRGRRPSFPQQKGSAPKLDAPPMALSPAVLIGAACLGRLAPAICAAPALLVRDVPTWGFVSLRCRIEDSAELRVATAERRNPAMPAVLSV